MNTTEKNENVERETQREIKQIEEKTLELINEVNEIKKALMQKQRFPMKSDLPEQTENEVSTVPLVDYIDELLKTSTRKIINEIRGEFYRLFNTLTSMGVAISSMERTEKFELKKESSKKVKTISAEEGKLSKNVKEELAKVELYKYLLTERESLIYELTDRLVAVETESNKIKQKLKKLEKEREEWEKQKEFLSKLLVTDPRYKIISLLKQTKVIAPTQLSFFLGVSLGQVREYLNQLKTMNIITFNDDGSVQLHKDFNVEVAVF